ncbi:hypothetical protein PCLA_12r0322 [Pseudomonas citronellolis]|nr:hypothetical protein PCLA_12r0322 [Pseudomonas citronellolis]
MEFVRDDRQAFEARAALRQSRRTAIRAVREAALRLMRAALDMLGMRG